MVPGFHLSAVILCAYTMLAAVESSSSEQLYCEFNLKMSHPAREEVMIKLLPRNSSAHAYYTSLCCTFHACVQFQHANRCPSTVHILSCTFMIVVVQYPPPLMPT